MPIPNQRCPHCNVICPKDERGRCTHCNKNRSKAVILYCNPRPKPVAQLIAEAMHQSFKD
jgi:hypothetical protein